MGFHLYIDQEQAKIICGLISQESVTLKITHRHLVTSRTDHRRETVNGLLSRSKGRTGFMRERRPHRQCENSQLWLYSFRVNSLAGEEHRGLSQQSVLEEVNLERASKKGNCSIWLRSLQKTFESLYLEGTGHASVLYQFRSLVQARIPHGLWEGDDETGSKGAPGGLAVLCFSF